MGTEFENYADLHGGVTGDTIRAAADDPNQNAIVIAALASELGEDEQHVAGDIEGDIEAGTRTNPQSAQQVATSLAQAGYYAVGLLNDFAGHVDTFDAGVDDLNTRLRSDVASAQRYAGQGAAATGDEPPTYNETWSSIKAYLQPEYNQLDENLETAAETVAAKFEQGATDDNVRELFDAGLIPMGMASLWPTIESEQNSEAAAIEAQELIDDINNGTFSGTSQEQVEALNNLLAEHEGDQLFAVTLMNSIGPDGVVTLNQVISQMEGDYPADPYGNEDGGPRNAEMGALILAFQQQFGQTLATATGGKDGYPPGTRDELQLEPDFVERLNERGRELSAPEWHNGPIGPEVYGYQALAPLLRTGEFSTDFLTEVGNGMYYFERGFEGENGETTPWQEVGINLGNQEGLRLDWTQGTGPGHSAGLDPMEGLMDALGNNPEASHAFFTDSRNHLYDGDGEDRDQEHGYNDKVRYLLNERVWGMPGDQPYMSQGVDEGGYYDEEIWNRENDTHPMDELGSALSAATGGGDQEAATLFGDIVYEIANGDVDSGKFEDIRDDLASMSSQHMGSINSYYANIGGGEGGDIDPVLEGLQFDPGLSAGGSTDLTEFLAEIGRDEDARTHLTAAQGIYQQLGYERYMGNDGSLDDRIGQVNARVNTPTGWVLGALDHGAGVETVEAQQESDDRENELTNNRFAVFNYLADQLPTSKLPVGGDLANMGIDAYLNQLQESAQVDNSDIANSLVGEMYAGNGRQVQNTAWDALYATMTPEDLEQFGDAVPRDGSGAPIPIYEWTNAEQEHWNENSANVPETQLIDTFSQNAWSSYHDARQAAQDQLR